MPIWSIFHMTPWSLWTTVTLDNYDEILIFLCKFPTKQYTKICNSVYPFLRNCTKSKFQYFWKIYQKKALALKRVKKVIEYLTQSVSPEQQLVDEILPTKIVNGFGKRHTSVKIYVRKIYFCQIKRNHGIVILVNPLKLITF